MNRLLAAEPDLVLLDVRTPLEHAEVHVARARNEPLVGLRPKILFDSGRLSKDRLVYLP
jgi:rhodanese-related sulfurtransferase